MRRVLLIVLLLVAAVLPCAGSGAPKTQTSRLVFAATVAYVGGEPQSQIYSLEATGRGAAQLTSGTEAATAPVPSPDGRHIAFGRDRALWVMRPNGSGQRLLTRRGSGPAWAPDSRRIAYVAGDGIHVIRLGGSGDRLLVRGDAANPAWSPDGRSLAFERDGSLLVLQGGVERTVIARPGVDFAGIIWSADGRWLAFEYGAPAVGYGLEVVQADGRRARLLPGGSTASWSPTRPLLAYVHFEAEAFTQSFELLNAVTGRVRRLGDAPRFLNSLAWSPSGAAIAFSGGAYLSEDLTAVSELGVITLAGRLRYLDHGLSFPLPESVAWTTPPGGLRYRAAQPVGPLVAKDELAFREPVDELAVDGDRVAYRSCGTIGVWRPGDARVVSQQVDRPLCGEGFISFYNLALAGDRVAWGVIRGGNQRSSSLVVEAAGDQTSRTVVAGHYQIAGDSRGDERAGFMLGEGPLLAFSTWAYCDEVVPATCPGLPYGHGMKIASQTLWRVREASWSGACPGITPGDSTGGRCQQLRAEPGPLRPVDIDEGRLVASGDNATVILDGDGRQLLSVPVPTQAAQLSGSDLVLLVPGELRDYDAATGALVHVWPLPDVPFGGFCGLPADQCGTPRLRLEDAAHGLVAYVLDGQIHLLRLADGRDVVLHAGTAARFGTDGLFYAYEWRPPYPSQWPGRLRFVPFSELPLR